MTYVLSLKIKAFYLYVGLGTKHYLRYDEKGEMKKDNSYFFKIIVFVSFTFYDLEANLGSISILWSKRRNNFFSY